MKKNKNEELLLICNILKVDEESIYVQKYSSHKGIGQLITIPEKLSKYVNSSLKEYYKNKINLNEARYHLLEFALFQLEDKLILSFPYVIGDSKDSKVLGTSVTVFDNKEDITTFLKTKQNTFSGDYEKMIQIIQSLDYPKLSPNSSLSDRIAYIKNQACATDSQVKIKNNF